MNDRVGKEAYRLEIDGELPLTTLIENRRRELGLSLAELAQRMGYESTASTGIHRLNALLNGDLKKFDNLKEPLLQGLALDEQTLTNAVVDSRYVLWARDDREYRRNFVPHIVWQTESRIPRSIAMAATGTWRDIYFYPESNRPQDWSEEASAQCPTGLALYGRVHGFWVNYSPDCAVSFNPRGEPMDVFDKAVRPGVPSSSHGPLHVRPKISSERLDKVDWGSLAE